MHVVNQSRKPNPFHATSFHVEPLTLITQDGALTVRRERVPTQKGHAEKGVVVNIFRDAAVIVPPL